MEEIGEQQPTTKKNRDSLGFGELKKALGGLQSAMIVIDKRDKFRKSITLSIFSSLTQILLGGVNTMVLGYVIKSGDVHAAFCTFGWHFFTAEAMLSFNYASGWSTPLLRKYRKLAHIFLQVLSLISIITGAVLTLTKSGVSTTPHGMTGFIAFIMTMVTVMLGPLGLYEQETFRILHIFLAIPTYLLSCTCLCIGVTLSSFKSYVGVEVSFILIGFVALSTTFIIGMVIVNLNLRIKYNL